MKLVGFPLIRFWNLRGKGEENYILILACYLLLLGLFNYMPHGLSSHKNGMLNARQFIPWPSMKLGKLDVECARIWDMYGMHK